MTTQLEEFDFTILEKALDALASKAASDGMMTGLLGLMLSKDKDEAEDRFEESMNKAKERGEETKDQITLVRAKLIQMKRELAVSEMGDVLRKGQ